MFSHKIDECVIRDCRPIFRKLNTSQRNVLLKTLKTDSYVLIKGLPGTGKRQFLFILFFVWGKERGACVFYQLAPTSNLPILWEKGAVT